MIDAGRFGAPVVLVVFSVCTVFSDIALVSAEAAAMFQNCEVGEFQLCSGVECGCVLEGLVIGDGVGFSDWVMLEVMGWNGLTDCLFKLDA